MNGRERVKDFFPGIGKVRKGGQLWPIKEAEKKKPGVGRAELRKQERHDKLHLFSLFQGPCSRKPKQRETEETGRTETNKLERDLRKEIK